MVEAHNAEHFKAIIQPPVQAMQIALGYAKPEQIQMLSMIVGALPPTGPQQGSPPKPNAPPGATQGAPAQATPQTRDAIAGGGE